MYIFNIHKSSSHTWCFRIVENAQDITCGPVENLCRKAIDQVGSKEIDTGFGVSKWLSKWNLEVRSKMKISRAPRSRCLSGLFVFHIFRPPTRFQSLIIPPPFPCDAFRGISPDDALSEHVMSLLKLQSRKRILPTAMVARVHACESTRTRARMPTWLAGHPH